MLAPLDWDKIAADLGNAGDATSKATLLEALRWRVSRSPTGEARRLVLQALSTNDPLALGSGAGQLLVQLLSKSHAAVREQTLRLLNALSFERAGRHYLLQSDTVLRSLWDCISGERSDTPVRQQALAALQKLSLSRHAQESIIALGAVEWLLKTLAQPEGLSSRTLEYGSALLLNLSLRASGRQRCEQCATANVVDVLAGLVAHENPQVRYYTDGVLYSVLQRPGVRARARAMGLEDVLKYTAQTSDDEFAKQIEYILMQLSSDDPEPSEDPVSDEDDDDEDDEEQSDDESDGAENEEESEEGSLLGSSSRGNPRGEELLAKKYLAKAVRSMRPSPKIHIHTHFALTLVCRKRPGESSKLSEEAVVEEAFQQAEQAAQHGGLEQPAALTSHRCGQSRQQRLSNNRKRAVLLRMGVLCKAQSRCHLRCHLHLLAEAVCHPQKTSGPWPLAAAALSRALPRLLLIRRLQSSSPLQSLASESVQLCRKKICKSPCHHF